jgi:membrane-bound lytic murein transglycosylase B
VAESPDTGEQRRPEDRPPGARLLAHRQRLLVAALVLAVVSGVSAAGAASTPRGGADTQLRDAAAAAPTRADSTPFAVGPAGAVTLPPAPVQNAAAEPADATAISGLAANGIPNVALNAYRVAADRINASRPGCGIDWSLLAGIGRVESNHGRFAGAVLNSDGTSSPQIVGPALDGAQFAFIGDSDDGRWDGDRSYDRAVGPMQFIPSTWRSYAIDADGDGKADPLDIDDASLASAHYLCVAGGDLRTEGGKRRAVLAYNHSDSYVAQVLALAAAYAAGIPVADLPLVGDTTSPVPAPSGDASGPAAPGPALGSRDTSPSQQGQATVLPAPAAPAAPAPDAGAGAPAEGPAGAPAGSGSGSGSGSAGGTGTGSAGSGSTGGGSAGQPATPSQPPAAVPSAPTPQLPVPDLPVPDLPLPELPAPAPLPLPVPVPGPLAPVLCQPSLLITCP